MSLPRVCSKRRRSGMNAALRFRGSMRESFRGNLTLTLSPFSKREREFATESPRLFAELSARSYNAAKLDSHAERKFFSSLNSR